MPTAEIITKEFTRIIPDQGGCWYGYYDTQRRLLSAFYTMVPITIPGTNVFFQPTLWTLLAASTPLGIKAPPTDMGTNVYREALNAGVLDQFILVPQQTAAIQLYNNPDQIVRDYGAFLLVKYFLRDNIRTWAQCQELFTYLLNSPFEKIYLPELEAELAVIVAAGYITQAEADAYLATL